MTEEQITKSLLKWLISNDWEIVCFDFPQSGTGKYLHPNEEIRLNETKNIDAFIPDIVAVKRNTVLFFENKNRFYLNDFIKLSNIKENNPYSNAIDKLLKKYIIQNYYYGIGAESSKSFLENGNIHSNKVDFILTVTDDYIKIIKGANILS